MTATVVIPRVWELLTVSGTGTVTTTGAAQAGYQSLAAHVTSGSLVCYELQDPTAGAWEMGIGTYTITTSPAGTLTRTTIVASSNSNSVVTFGGNVCNLWLTLLPPVQVTAGASNAGYPILLNSIGLVDPSMTNGAYLQAQPSNPTAPASTSAFTMQGLAQAITPARTGRLEIIVTGNVIAPASTVVDNGIIAKIMYGTGTAPANGAAVTGTQIGSAPEYTHSVAPTAIGDVHYPFSLQASVTGLVVGTAYWFDLAAEAVTTASSVGFANLNVAIKEF